jgi:hypothetical protein
MGREQVDGFERMMGDVADLQAHGVRRADEAADEVAKLFKASVGYAAAVADQMRALTVDTAKRTVDVIAPER